MKAHVEGRTPSTRFAQGAGANARRRSIAEGRQHAGTGAPPVPPAPRITSAQFRSGPPVPPPDTPRLPAPPPRPASGRVAKTTGWLMKRGEGKGLTGSASWKKRWCVLQPGKGLLYLRTPKSSQAAGVVPATAMGRATPGDDARAFDVEPADADGRTFHFKVPDDEPAELAQVWIAAISAMCLRAKTSPPRPSTEERRRLSNARAKEARRELAAENEDAHRERWESQDDLSQLI